PTEFTPSQPRVERGRPQRLLGAVENVEKLGCLRRRRGPFAPPGRRQGEVERRVDRYVASTSSPPKDRLQRNAGVTDGRVGAVPAVQQLLQVKKDALSDVGQLPITKHGKDAEPESDLVVTDHRGLVRLLPLIPDLPRPRPG